MRGWVLAGQERADGPRFVKLCNPVLVDDNSSGREESTVADDFRFAAASYEILPVVSSS